MASTHSRIGQVLSEDSFLLSLQEAENNLLHITLGSLPAFNNLPSGSQKDEKEDNPVLALLYDNLLPILSGVRPETPKITEKCKSAENLISLLEVAEHDSMEDCWIVLFDRVYDITKFLHSHPGGYDVVMEHAGRDATFAFLGTGHSDEAVSMLKKFEIGILPMEERLYRHETPIFKLDGLPE